MASHLSGNANHSAAIRNEITRFESVHPSIYAIYDLIESLPEGLQERIREHVVCIEGMSIFWLVILRTLSCTLPLV